MSNNVKADEKNQQSVIGKKVLNRTKQLLYALIIPVALTLIFVISVSAQGRALFNSQSDYQIFVKQVVVALLIAFAFGIHMNQGRMDFSIGATMILGEIVSSMIMVKTGNTNNIVLFFIVIVLVTCLLSVFGGVIYVVLRIPPMISGLGMTLLYEGIAYQLCENDAGVSRYDLVSNNFTITFSGIAQMLILALVMMLIMLAIYKYSKWSFDSSLLQNGQIQAVQCGVKEIPNTLIGYALAGILIGVAGFVTVCNASNIDAKVGFGSTSVMISAMLPMFIGGFISTFISYPFAIFFGAFSSTMLSYGLTKTFIRTNGSTVSAILNSLFLLFFLAFMFNQVHIKEFVHLKTFIKNKKDKKELRREMEGLEN